MPNPFIHVELSTTHTPKAKAFYTKLFKWKLRDLPAPSGEPYTIIEVGKGTGGAIMKQVCPDAPSAWMPYVQVDDIIAATKKAKKLGAKIVKDVTEVKGICRFSVILDPTGAAIGLVQPEGM